MRMYVTEESAMAQMMSTGTVARHLGVSTSLLRRLEKAGTIPPAQRIAGLDRRVYDETDLEQLRKILADRRARRTDAAEAAA